MDPNFEQVCDKLAACNSFVVVTHISPDADAIGSATALYRGLRKLGKSCVICLDEAPAEKLGRLLDDVEYYSSVNIKGQYDCLVAVDTASRDRVCAKIDDLTQCVEQTVNIDHHISNPKWANINYIDSTSASCAEIVFRVLKRLAVEIDTDIADRLLIGLTDDTGSFRYANVNRQALQAAADLVGLGARPTWVAEVLYYSVQKNILLLRAEAVSNTKFEVNGKLAVVIVKNDLMGKFAVAPENLDGVIDIARAFDEVCAVLFIKQTADGWKASLRSKIDSLDVNLIAKIFGGGGHKLAAGCKFVGELEIFESRLIQAFSQAIQDLR